MLDQQLKFEKELSKCARCGSCKAFCPTFDTEGLESRGARGRLRLLKGLLEGRIKPSPLLNDHIFSCILCGACSGSCPLGIDIPEAIYYGRSLLKKSDSERRRLRSLARFSARWPDLSFKLTRMVRRILLPALVRNGVIPFSPELPDAALGSSEQVFSVQKKRGRVALFPGCSITYLFPHLGESLIRVFNALRYEVVLPRGLVCCGTPLRTLGLEEDAAALAQKNLRSFSKLNVEAVVSLCPTCTLSLHTEYPKMVGEGIEKAIDVSVFLADKLDATSLIGKSAVFHDPCHLIYGLGVKKEPREIIGKAGIELREAREQGCCGFGGVFCFSYKNIANSLLALRTKNFFETNADMVITSCPGCMLQLSQSITDRPVLHLIELIEEAYCDRPSQKK